MSRVPAGTLTAISAAPENDSPMSYSQTSFVGLESFLAFTRRTTRSGGTKSGARRLVGLGMGRQGFQFSGLNPG